MNAETEILVRTINSFFYIYLPKQRCFSKNTVDSYKTVFNLLGDYLFYTTSRGERHPMSRDTVCDCGICYAEDLF